MARQRKIPQRMCVGCKVKKNKRDLVRVVRTPEQELCVDLTGKKSGRGAYICPSIDCLQKALKNKGLERSLELPISEALIEKLQEQLVK